MLRLGLRFGVAGLENDEQGRFPRIFLYRWCPAQRSQTSKVYDGRFAQVEDETVVKS